MLLYSLLPSHVVSYLFRSTSYLQQGRKSEGLIATGGRGAGMMAARLACRCACATRPSPATTTNKLKCPEDRLPPQANMALATTPHPRGPAIAPTAHPGSAPNFAMHTLGAPADLLLDMLGGFLQGKAPSTRDVVLVRTAILQVRGGGVAVQRWCSLRVAASTGGFARCRGLLSSAHPHVPADVQMCQGPRAHKGEAVLGCTPRTHSHAQAHALALTPCTLALPRAAQSQAAFKRLTHAHFLAQCRDLYQPLDLSQRLREARLEDDVARSLLREVGAFGAELAGRSGRPSNSGLGPTAGDGGNGGGRGGGGGLPGGMPGSPHMLIHSKSRGSSSYTSPSMSGLGPGGASGLAYGGLDDGAFDTLEGGLMALSGEPPGTQASEVEVGWRGRGWPWRVFGLTSAAQLMGLALAWLATIPLFVEPPP